MNFRVHHTIGNSLPVPFWRIGIGIAHPSKIVILFSFLLFIICQKGLSQCDTKVSGVFTYCNSFDNGNPVSGYFVGFRVADHTGDTLNVVDLNGTVITNHGKRVDNIGDLEPANTSNVPLRISGVGADSIEYWYFGPYANGATFNIALIDPSNTCDTIFVASGTYNCADNTGISDPGACGPPSSGAPPVPLYYLDFSNEAFDLGNEGNGDFIANKFYIMNRTREQTCCDVGGSAVRCMEMIITLGPNDIGLAIDDIGSGNTAGKLYADSINGFSCTGNTDLTYPYQQGGGQSNDTPLCFNDVSARDYVVLSCKAGGNPTFLTIATLPTFFATAVVASDCDIQINTYNASIAYWSSPDDPGLDNLISCGADSLYCSFSYNSMVFGPMTACTDTFHYIIAANPEGNFCLPGDTLIYDTVTVIVRAPLSVNIDRECVGNDSISLTAIVSSEVTGCNYELHWSNGATTPSIIVPISNVEYKVTVNWIGLPPGFLPCPAVDSIIAVGEAFIDCGILPSPVLNCISDIPPVDLSVIHATGCNNNFTRLAHTISNNGAGCPGDTLVLTRYYIIDFDNDTITSLYDRDTCIQYFRFVDTLPPVIICPPNVTIQCGASTVPGSTGSATAIDNCDTSPGISFSNQISNGSCPQSYVINRRWIAEDNCQNRDTCYQLITVQDITPPVITCPADRTIGHNESSAPSNTGSAMATDCNNVPSITYVDSIINTECSLYHFIKRRWYATDACGNQNQCLQWIAVNDAGSICGWVLDDTGQPIAGVQLQLFADMNANLAVDSGDTIVMSVISAMNGSYCFTNLVPCNYVINEIQPINYGQQSDTDATPDPDGNDSADGPDDQIPAFVAQAENDLDNNFIDLVCTTQLPILPFDTVCSGQSVIVQISNPVLGSTYSWNFGSGSSPTTGIGPGPHTVSYVTTTQNQDNGSSVVLTLSKAGCTDITGEVTHIQINDFPNTDINTSLTPICYYTDKTFEPVADPLPGASYLWNFGTGAVPTTAIGYGPHTVYYTTTGSKSVKLVVYPNEPGAQCPDSSTVSFNVTLCPGQIAGYILTPENQPIPNVTIRLYADSDVNGIADNGTPVRTVSSNAIGLYTMASLTPGNYVIIETQPSGWMTFDDYDESDDNDIVANLDNMDNLIPVTILVSEIDSMNNFIETAQPGSITGSVFADVNGNTTPDIGEGIDMVTISLYADANTDGQADNNVVLAAVQSNSNGNYSFGSVGVGNYVLVESNPAEYFSFKDIDPTNDGDVVPNTNQNNDTIPVTVSNNESDANNYFIDLLICPRMVTNTNDSGYGSFRYNLECSVMGDTIQFATSLTGGMITIDSSMVVFDKSVVVISTLAPPLSFSSTIPGLFSILPNITAELSGFNVYSGLGDNSQGTAFENQGTLILNNVFVFRNPLNSPSDPLLHNLSGSSVFLYGYCMFGN